MQNFIDAYKLIDTPFKFIHGNLSVDKKGNAVDPMRTKAIAFDMIGALTKVHDYSPQYEGIECVTYPPKELEKEIEVLTTLARKAFPICKNYSLGPINDMLSFDDIRDLFSLVFYGAR